MGETVLAQVEEWSGGRYESVAVTVDLGVLDQLTPADRAWLGERIRRACDNLRALGCTDPETLLSAEAVRRIADARAYTREATRRGVLAL